MGERLTPQPTVTCYHPLVDFLFTAGFFATGTAFLVFPVALAFAIFALLPVAAFFNFDGAALDFALTLFALARPFFGRVNLSVPLLDDFNWILSSFTAAGSGNDW